MSNRGGYNPAPVTDDVHVTPANRRVRSSLVPDHLVQYVYDNRRQKWIASKADDDEGYIKIALLYRVYQKNRTKVLHVINLDPWAAKMKILHQNV